MATYDWPITLLPQRAAIGSQGAGEQFKSPYNGTLQAVDFVAERWVLSVTLPQRGTRDAGAVEAFFFRLRGGVNRVRAWHFGRPVPIGTMRGTPTLSAGVSRGGTSLPITGGTASGTLKAGDMLGAGGQLFMVAEDVALNGSGAGTVPLVHRVRATINTGAAVTWNRPTAEWVMPAWLAAVAHFPGGIDGAAFDFEEAW
jgi:hypothetical protein